MSDTPKGCTPSFTTIVPTRDKYAVSARKRKDHVTFRLVNGMEHEGRYSVADLNDFIKGKPDSRLINLRADRHKFQLTVKEIKKSLGL